jgi:hypothetical protein
LSFYLSVNDGFIQRRASFPQEPGALSCLAREAECQPPDQEQLMVAPAEPETYYPGMKDPQ